MNRPRAAVFDLDGTLVDNMRFHGDAWLALAARLGASATREDFERTWAGKKADEIFAILLGRRLSAAESEALEQEKEHAYRAAYRPAVAPVRGLFPFLDQLSTAGFRLAIATAAPEANRTMVLEGLGLASRFEVVVGPEGAGVRGKPFPDIYLAAAKALDVPAADCLAFEDAVNGVASARAAGMDVAGVLTSSGEAELRAAGARYALRDYASLPAELERLLFG
ncbi:MAG TPA: HAD family phosphatase [Anaeromyxobacteraceae bacterium]